ncbi:hypothetical protein B0H16DRAFT_1478344 [Mycena metata]|uniref:Uncharacterized protein n=1 Tax=Mycena metata TaxID=1033252 RepID=A0AAD7MET2_9AGAR|nr:hypothetical protein B0H16DRAFT_1478344 [Mycena metata]
MRNRSTLSDQEIKLKFTRWRSFFRNNSTTTPIQPEPSNYAWGSPTLLQHVSTVPSESAHAPDRWGRDDAVSTNTPSSNHLQRSSLQAVSLAHNEVMRGGVGHLELATALPPSVLSANGETTGGRVLNGDPTSSSTCAVVDGHLDPPPSYGAAIASDLPPSYEAAIASISEALPSYEEATATFLADPVNTSSSAPPTLSCALMK